MEYSSSVHTTVTASYIVLLFQHIYKSFAHPQSCTVAKSIPYTMLQRQLARSARTLAAQASECRISQVTRTPFRVAGPSYNGRTLAAVRAYSSGAEPAKEDAAAEKKGEAKEEDPVQKELEAKRKETTELTVRVIAGGANGNQAC